MSLEIVQCNSEAITICDFFITLLLPRLALCEYAGEPKVKDLYILETTVMNNNNKCPPTCFY